MRREFDEGEERERLAGLKVYEDRAYSKGYRFIAGIDEVGRGPIAGPVVAAAVILPQDFFLPGVNDSKKLSKAKRARFCQEIMQKAINWSVAYIFPPLLDEINVLNATKLAMKECIAALYPKPDFLLIDAIKLNDINIKQLGIIKGDSQSISIACASILAKVERDRSMDYYAELYPDYGFEKHKGYATKEHVRLLAANGPCPIHRSSFEPVKSFQGGPTHVQQLSLFN